MELLKVTNLHTSFFTPAGEVKAVNGISFSLEKGKVLGIVGESGSGKSVTAYSILQILANPGKIVDGSIFYAGQELVGASKEEMRKIRGNKISLWKRLCFTQAEIKNRLRNAPSKCSVSLALTSLKSA